MFGIGSESQLKLMSGNIFNMILFDKFKTGDHIIDAIFTTIILTSITYILQFINHFIIDKLNFTYLSSSFNIIDLCYKKYSVEYEGKISIITNKYDFQLNETSAFSDRFKSLWHYIIENVGNNDTIHHIKEYSFTTLSSNRYNEYKRDFGIYMVIQNDKFLISKKHEIYAYTSINSHSQENDEDQNKKNKNTNKIDKIKIELFSYKSNVQVIKEFVDELTIQYVSSIQNSRENKRFIYTLTKTNSKDDNCELWNETIFSSTRTFNNLFFSGKMKFIKELDFFLHSKNWYFEKGIPYSLGIGMYGPPGTGKTSLIKAIANYTNRHIITISLKLIKTKKQLDNIFFEDRYNLDNNKDSISFDKKIIVFEDIDCMGDIVLDREKNKQKLNIGIGSRKLMFDELSSNSKISVGDLLETIVATEKASEQICVLPKMPIDEEPITLDDILNLWDGIRETPGRIMIISSNHYHELDPALIRPGRIDLTLELSYTSHEIIKEMYKHFFDQDLPDDKLSKIPDKFYSPAEIINIYMKENRDKNKFIDRLSTNKHV